MPESKSKSRSSRSRASPAKKTEPKKKRCTSSTTSKKSKEAAARATTASTPAPSAVLIVDNGGDKLKYGWMTPNADAATSPQYLPNVTARLKHQLTILVGDQVEETAERNPSQMYAITRSTERGIVTHLGNQVQVWKRMLDLLGVVIPPPLLDHGEASKAFGWKVTHRRKQQPQTQQQQTTQRIPAVSVAVLLLVPPHCPRLVLDQMMHVWMEDFGVSHVGFATSQMCATQPHPDYQTGCLVDVGWSATHVVPTFQNMPQQNAIRRMPLGGRHLVNIWKYYASYRQYNLMDQEWILRDVVRQLAYISLDFQKELQLAQSTLPGRRSFDRNFVLPDYQTTFRGQVELTDFAKYQLEQEEAQRKKKEQEENNAQQQQQKEVDDESEEDDEDFNDENQQPQEDDDNAQDEVEKMDEDENSPDGEDADNDTKRSKKKKRKKSRKKKRGKRKRDQEEEEDDDEEEEEDEDDNKQLLRQRLLRQQQEEERRRRELEAEQQVLSVSVERFTVPEVLFRPSDANLPVELAGLPHLILQSIKACPSYLQPALYRSIHITGGLSQLPNLQPRLEQELRTLIPNELEMKVTLSEHPVDGAWLGARDWIREKPYTQWSVSRDEWEASQKRKAWIKLLTVNGGALV